MKSRKQSQQGSGSAENIGSNRDSQKSKLTRLSEKDQQNIASEINEGESHMADLSDLGGLSGRDDYAGAPGDVMTDESTNEETDR
jgi:hypothetical protein